MKESKQYMSTVEAGRMLGFGRHWIVKLILAGKLEGYKLERQWVVDRSSVERMKKRREMTVK